MPLYEYLCRNCNDDFEVLVRTRDQAITCPNCKGENITKLISIFAHSSSEGGGNASGCNTCATRSCSTCH